MGIFPQHIFDNNAYGSEQMKAVVIQIAIGNRLGSMLQVDCSGENFHNNTISSGNTITPYGLNS
jgi:hypothetical protein